MSLTPICETSADTVGPTICPEKSAIQSPWGTLLVSLDRYAEHNIRSRFPVSPGIGPGFDPTTPDQRVPTEDDSVPTQSQSRASGVPVMLALGILIVGGVILMVK